MKIVITDFKPSWEESEEIRLTFVTDEFKQGGNQISYITVSRLDDIGYDRTYVANGIPELEEVLDKLDIIHPKDVGEIRKQFLTNKLFRKKFFETWDYTEDDLEADINCLQDRLMEKFYDDTTNVYGRLLEDKLKEEREQCLKDGFVEIFYPKMCEVLDYISKEDRMGDKELYDYDFNLCTPTAVEIDHSKGFDGFEWDMESGNVKVNIYELSKEEKAELVDTLDAFGLI